MKTLIASICLVCVLASVAEEKKSEVASEPKILSRKKWGAKAPVAEMKKHSPKKITIHHTAVKQKPERSLAEKLRALQEFSQNEGKLGNGKSKPAWPDVPYHFYIDCKGNVGEGRDANFVGDTNTEYDPSGHLLIVLEGNFEEEKPTKEQLESLRQMTRWLMTRWKIPAEEIAGHKDFAKTQCPGKALEDYLPELRKAVSAGGASSTRP